MTNKQIAAYLAARTKGGWGCCSTELIRSLGNLGFKTIKIETVNGPRSQEIINQVRLHAWANYARAIRKES
jgi:hypothetical protein